MTGAELLSPAGDRERLDAAVEFGADAVYLGGREFGMRSSPANFDEDGLRSAASCLHSCGKKLYLTCNTVPRNDECSRLPGFLEMAADAGTDAFIITDLGVLAMAKRYAPHVEVHISTQAGVVNYAAANAFYDLGASRVVLARELSLEEIAGIRSKTPKDLELEAFVHGSMCMSFSGRCLLSNYLTGRDGNRGDCAQPCRWEYSVVESKRPGEYFPVVEDEKGSYLFNSRDLCMIEHIPEMLQAGVDSLKIEGRAKSSYYVAVVTNAYRRALDWHADNPGLPLPGWIREELDKVSHREYASGFYFGKEPGQILNNGGYLRDYEVIAVCEDWSDGVAKLIQRNRFFRGDTADVLEAGKDPYFLRLDELYDSDFQPIESAPHAAMTVFARCAEPVKKGAFFRKKVQ